MAMIDALHGDCSIFLSIHSSSQLFLICPIYLWSD